MSNIHTDLSIVPISVAPSPATSGTSLGVTDAYAALLPSIYPWWALVKPTGTAPTRANSEILAVTAGNSAAGTTTYTITRAQGVPVTTARTIIVGDDILEVHTAQKQIDTEAAITTAADLTANAIWDAKGDLAVGTGADTAAKLTAGTNGQKLVANSGETTGLEWADDFGSNSFVYETPSGTVNGSNTDFTITSAPISGSLEVSRDGVDKYETNDWTLSGTTITFVTAPLTGSVLRVKYQVASTASANADTLDGVHASATPTAGQIPVLDSAMAMIGNSMARQAIINGNFDVWQRGTSVAGADASVQLLADHWATYIGKDGGTLPTLTMSRQAQTAGALQGSYYFWRLNTNGAGTSLGVNSEMSLYQKIENSTRNLCGNGQKVTVSFYAKSDIATKRICPTLYQYYGSGGSPSAGEFIQGTPITLTSSWVKYTATFTTNTLSGKTFGTANDDYLQVQIWMMWGTTIGNTRIQTSVTAETFVGSGNIDIAQVQLCAGDVALPFMPKSFDEELRACRRYAYVPATDSTNSIIASGAAASTTRIDVDLKFPMGMRIEPTLESATATDWQVSDYAGGAIDLTVIALDSASSGKDMVSVICTVASGATANRPYKLQCDGTANRVLVLTSEL